MSRTLNWVSTVTKVLRMKTFLPLKYIITMTIHNIQTGGHLCKTMTKFPKKQSWLQMKMQSLTNKYQ